MTDDANTILEQGSRKPKMKYLLAADILLFIGLCEV